MGVPLGLNYIFYKHGPFSFDLNDQLTALRGNSLVELRSHAPYGPHLHTSQTADGYLGLFTKTIGSFGSDMDFVICKLASKNVAELERLSTALYVRMGKPGADDAELAEEMNRLKPHVSVQDALEALREVEAFDRERISTMTR